MLGEIFGVDGIIVLIVVLVVLFGGAAIPKFARNLGSAKTEFEKGLKESSQASSQASGTSEASAADGPGAGDGGAAAKAAGETGPVTPK